MAFAKILSPRKWFTVILSGCILTSILFGVIALRVAQQIKVDGPVVGLLVDSKDLLADILPPPHCIIEAYVTASQACQAADAKKRDELIASIAELKNAYYASQERWQTFRDSQLSERNAGTRLNSERVIEMYDALLVKSHAPAELFFKEFEQRVVPAIRSGDTETAQQIFESSLEPAYAEHRQGIDSTVKLAEQYAKAIEAVAKGNGEKFSATLMALVGTVIAGFCGMGFYFYRLQKQSDIKSADLEGQLNAIDASQGTIEFKLDGTIVNANANFLKVLGYSLDEIVGKHHSLFIDPVYALSPEYRQFWNELASGKSQVSEFKRLGKNGKEIWIQASYNPIADHNGKIYKVVKFATDVTASKLATADFQGQLQAIGKSQAVIEFDLQGNVQNANENFLTALGYRLDEIKGKHHSLFVEAAYANSHEYQTFWEDLRAGRYRAAEYKRIGKNGKEVWIQASYNPILDMNGKPFKVVKYATDITSAKLKAANYEGQLNAIDKAQATIEFNLDGTIRTANKNFLDTVGYSLDEIKGKNHSMFVASGYADSTEYRKFWDDLRAGRFQAAQYKRVGKGGKEFWIQASYNPIFDLNGNPLKIVKFATDITAAKRMEIEVAEAQERNAAREREQAAELQRKVAVVLQIVSSVADGKFDVEIPQMGDDAVGQVVTALGQAVNSMKSALGEVRDVSVTVSSAAEQLTAVSREITAGAQTQASSLEETASSLEEITSTVKQNTDNAQQARQLANGSRDIAEKGGSVVSEAVQAMGEINQSSKKIADIITTIDEIAFQTNLLALNAAVEAARAGEQGRGFAVVAAEVRNLAQRSASAAKEIKALIQDSVRKVENGTDLVNKSGQTLSEIVNSVKRVTDIVSEIAAASKEQLTGIEQVNKAVSQMDRVTQANASQTEEMSGTATSLLSHAVQLNDLVGRFQLDSETVQASRAATTKKEASKAKRSSEPQARSTRIAAPINLEPAATSMEAGVLEF